MNPALATTPQIRVLDDPVRACADALREAASTPGGGQVVLAGGSTPKAAYERASEDPGSFKGATIWFGDERCVEPDDERSNFRMVKLALLDPLAAAGVQTVCNRMSGERGAEAAALAYERLLRDAATEVPPRFDLLLLGVGPDGHTASLFPNQLSLSEKIRLVVGVPEAGLEPFVPRVTLTLPAMAGAERVIVLAKGEEKADAIAAAFGSDATPRPDVPSSLLPAAVRPGALTVLLDPAAASKL